MEGMKKGMGVYVVWGGKEEVIGLELVVGRGEVEEWEGVEGVFRKGMVGEGRVGMRWGEIGEGVDY